MYFNISVPSSSSTYDKYSDTSYVGQIVLIVVLVFIGLLLKCRKRNTLPEIDGYNNIEMSNIDNIVGYEQHKIQEQNNVVTYDEEFSA
jgi:hypothetical protein